MCKLILESLAAVAAGIIWASGSLFVRNLQAFGLQGMVISLLRLSLAWVILTICLVRRFRQLFKVSRRDLLFLALLGAIGPAGSQPLFIESVTLTTVAVATILNYTAPFFVIILSRLFLKEPVTPHKALALGLSAVGLVLITGVYKVQEPVSAPALITGLGSGALYGTYTFMLRKIASRHDPLTVQWWSALFGLPLLTLYTLPSLEHGFVLPLRAWGSALGLAAGPGVLAFILFTWALARIQASRVAILANIEPAAATLFSALVLGENITLPQIAGIGLVLAGIITATSAQVPAAAIRVERGEA